MLDDQLYQNWLLQLQTWAACGRLFSAGVAALRLKSGNTTDQLKRIAHRLAKGKNRYLHQRHRIPHHFRQLLYLLFKSWRKRHTHLLPLGSIHQLQ